MRFRIRVISGITALCLAGFMLHAQSQRMVLVEEFTQASCPACAQVNPAFNALLTANSDKVIPLKYQVWWPGTDPMYQQNPADVGARVSYYQISGVPACQMDGNAFGGYPPNLSQAMIDAEYNQPAPFTIQLSHQFNAMLDSLTITLVLTATQAVSGNFRLHTVLTENQISFATPPGTNGESLFRHVMRKMIPGTQGELLSSTWISGQSQVLSYTLAVPDYYYAIRNLAVLAFIQEQSTKNVKQAVFSAPLPLTADSLINVGLDGITGLDPVECSLPLQPSIVLKNAGSVPIMTASIWYRLDNDAWAVLPWTGMLAPNATVSVDLPGLNPAVGLHALSIKVRWPNGNPDLYPLNNTLSAQFTYTTGGIALPVNESFLSAAFPPPDWFLKDIGNTGKTWTRTTSCGGFGLSTQSARIPFFSMSTVGETDELYLPPLDLSTVAGSRMVFSLAYAQYSASYTDRLKVMVSPDCGTNWTTVYDKQAGTLATAPMTTSSFVPTATQWRKDTVDLSAWAGAPQVFVKFVAINGYGNNCYVDDIQVLPLNCSLNGTVTYKNTAATPIPSGTLSLYKAGTLYATTQVNANGTYSFQDIPPAIYTLRMQPAGNWGGGNSLDALLVLKHFTGMSLLNGLNRTAGDADGNAYLNSIDALWISKRFVNIVSSFPAGNWVSENPQVSLSGLLPHTINLKVLCTGDVDGSYIP